jgi:hypothetical protein
MCFQHPDRGSLDCPECDGESNAIVEKALEAREEMNKPTDPLVYVQGRLVPIQHAIKGEAIGDGRIEGK